MSRRYPLVSESDYLRLSGQKHTLPPQEAHIRVCRHSRLGSQRPAWSHVERMETGYIFTYVDWLPRIIGHQVNRYARSRLTKKGRSVFGILPPLLYPQRRAHVEIIRVLGPYQKPMDDDSIALVTGGLRDSLTPSYIRDDSAQWARFECRNDGGRRQQGPCIEIIITYEEILSR